MAGRPTASPAARAGTHPRAHSGTPTRGTIGGMYWPAAVEPVSPRTLSAWESLSYPRLCEEVLKRFIAADDPDVTPLDLAGIVSAAFSSFGDAEVVSLRPLSDELHVAELWHGPTLAFKDLGMSVLGRTLSHLLRRRRQRLTLLVGTSGDTGSSAMEAVRGLEGIEILVLYPLQGCPSTSPALQSMQSHAISRTLAQSRVGARPSRPCRSCR
jgi:threonine synthase